MTTTDHMQIAETILAQLGGLNRISPMIGVKHSVAFPASEAGPASVFCPQGQPARGAGVGVRFKAAAVNGANHVEIVLEDSDTYTVTFWRIRGGARMGEPQKITEHVGIYADGLRPLFESKTGLRLSL